MDYCDTILYREERALSDKDDALWLANHYYRMKNYIDAYTFYSKDPVHNMNRIIRCMMHNKVKEESIREFLKEQDPDIKNLEAWIGYYVYIKDYKTALELISKCPPSKRVSKYSAIVNISLGLPMNIDDVPKDKKIKIAAKECSLDVLHNMYYNGDYFGNKDLMFIYFKRAQEFLEKKEIQVIMQKMENRVVRTLDTSTDLVQANLPEEVIVEFHKYHKLSTWNRKGLPRDKTDTPYLKLCSLTDYKNEEMKIESKVREHIAKMSEFLLSTGYRLGLAALLYLYERIKEYDKCKMILRLIIKALGSKHVINKHGAHIIKCSWASEALESIFTEFIGDKKVSTDIIMYYIMLGHPSHEFLAKLFDTDMATRGILAKYKKLYESKIDLIRLHYEFGVGGEGYKAAKEDFDSHLSK